MLSCAAHLQPAHLVGECIQVCIRVSHGHRHSLKLSNHVPAPHSTGEHTHNWQLQLQIPPLNCCATLEACSGCVVGPDSCLMAPCVVQVPSAGRRLFAVGGHPEESAPLRARTASPHPAAPCGTDTAKKARRLCSIHTNTKAVPIPVLHAPHPCSCAGHSLDVLHSWCDVLSNSLPRIQLRLLLKVSNPARTHTQCAVLLTQGHAGRHADSLTPNSGVNRLSELESAVRCSAQQPHAGVDLLQQQPASALFITDEAAAPVVCPGPQCLFLPT